MKNPISEATRGKIYLFGLISGPVFTVLSAVLMVVLGVNSPWLGVIGVLAGAVLTVTSTLARANLSGLDEGKVDTAIVNADTAVVNSEVQ